MQNTHTKPKLLLFDLDGTLLRSDKTISERTLTALNRCRNLGILVGIATSRSEANCVPFLKVLNPEVFISSGGTIVKYQKKLIYTLEFTPEETRALIRAARDICGSDCEITVDTQTYYYWNYKTDPNEADTTWGETVWTDYADFREYALKICVQTKDSEAAAKLSARLSGYNCIRFSGTDWYQFTKGGATKENGARILSRIAGIPMEAIAAFGDDLTDIGMLQACGTGVAMGNANEAVKASADLVIGSNDEDGIAEYLDIHIG